MFIGKRNKEDNVLYRKVYGVWYNMHSRCYNPKNHAYASYGGRGVFVSARWHKLDNFIEDIDDIDGFDMELFLSEGLALDKDKKISDNKEYSKDNCMFTTLESNNSHKPNQQKWVVGVSPKGVKYSFFNQSGFAREHELRQSSIADCLSGKCKTHKNWTFSYKKLSGV